MRGIPTSRTAGSRTLRPWSRADAPARPSRPRTTPCTAGRARAYGTEARAVRRPAEQARGRRTGNRFALVAEEDTRLVGHVVLKYPACGAGPAGVGYWTLPHARGCGVATRQLDALTDRAFTTFAQESPTRLELLHRADNTASCRVATRSGLAPTSAVRPARVPAHLSPRRPPAPAARAHHHVIATAPEPTVVLPLNITHTAEGTHHATHGTGGTGGRGDGGSLAGADRNSSRGGR
ncbi:GNAT family N-acetyltransferase [Streptomyces sp. NPDC005931]|uniref:GNAT family N-acetyltransferase n=1 Tax=Streptomyces sp. NPDC005931 TaxID=3364737 RepID=UPI003674267C